MMDDPSRKKPYGGGAEAALVITGGLKNLTLVESHDFSASSGLDSLDFRIQGDITAEVKLTGGFEADLGFYSRAWNEVADEKLKLLGLSAKLTGLDSQDKIGKYPVAGLVFSVKCPSTCPVVAGTTQTPVRAAKELGIIVWLYATINGKLTLDGEIGGRVNAGRLDVGLIKPSGGDVNFTSNFSPSSSERLIEAPFLNGEMGLELNAGLDMDVDLFMAGVRVASTGLSLVRVQPSISVKTTSEISYGTESFDSPWSWQGEVCFVGNLGVGAIARAAIDVGVSLEVGDRITTSGGYSYEAQFPTEADMLLPGVNGTWYNFPQRSYCFPGPEVTAVSSTINDSTVTIVVTGTSLPADLTLTVDPESKCGDVQVVPEDAGNGLSTTRRVFTCTVDNVVTRFSYNLSSDKAENLDVSKVSSELYYSNDDPVANAGADKQAIKGTSVTLSGLGSSDGDTLSYAWTQTGGPTVALINANTAIPSFTATESGTLTFTLVVKDGRGGISVDKIVVVVTTDIPSPPVLRATAGDSKITVSWDRVPNAVGYGVCYAIVSITDINNCTAYAGGNWVATTEPLLEIAGLINGLTYYIRAVSGGEAGGESTASAEVSATPVSTPVTTGKINDTGITLCGDYAYGDNSGNHNNDIACSRTADDDGDPVPAGQDGHFGRDVTDNDNSDGHAGFSFTKISSTGATLPASATTWSCVQDNVTGLMWEVKTDDGGLHDKDWTYSWYQSDSSNNGGRAGYQNNGVCGNTSACDTEAYVAAVNAAGWCGYSDWRLPEKEALISIINYSVLPAIDENYFSSGKTPHWSSSPYAYSSYSAWIVHLNSGLDYRDQKHYGRYVLLVRSGQ